MSDYQLIESFGGVPIKAWVNGVPLEEKAAAQLQNVSKLPIVHKWLAVMPDVHLGYGATIGSVIPTRDAVIPAAVGVDIGCGMMAVQTSLKASDLPDDLTQTRNNIERAVPHGKSNRGKRDKGAWHNPPAKVEDAWKKMAGGYRRIIAAEPRLDRGQHQNQLGTLGGGNHFVELCLDEADAVWVMLHSGSRGVGNRIGQHYIALARKDMERHQVRLPDMDLSYFSAGSELFDHYVFAVEWAQRYARVNRDIMMENVLAALHRQKDLPGFQTKSLAVNCHHNYVNRETHYGEEVFVTRKGAVRAGLGEYGIIPGSMGAKSFIVKGLGNAESFNSCSHGAGRVMSRTKAKKVFSLEDHAKATEGVECRKDLGVLDETPGAYKDIEAVMKAQKDLVEVVHTLKQIVCVKG